MHKSIKFILFIMCLWDFFLSATAWSQTKNPFIAHINPISSELVASIKKYSWHFGCPVSLNDLVAIQLTYWGFDHQTHQGTLIMNKLVAADVVTIFHTLYEQHFPIARMQPMANFKGDDTAAMAANDTTGFNCRLITFGNHYSAHAYGTAVDINPLFNPYVNETIVLPPQATYYTNRNIVQAGMTRQNDPVYRIFHQNGWRWGGDWVKLKDYQHFEKDFSK